MYAAMTKDEGNAADGRFPAAWQSKIERREDHGKRRQETPEEDAKTQTQKTIRPGSS
jgi:hypothetical protein